MRTIIIALLFAAVALHAQTPAQPWAVTKQQFFNQNGQTLALGTVSTYVAGTSTPIATCQDSQCAASNLAVIPLDAAGRANIFLAAGQGYKLIVADSMGVQQFVADNITASNTNTSLPLAGGTITGNLTVSGTAIFNGPTVFGGACSGAPCLWQNLNNVVSLVNTQQTVSPLKIQNQAVSGDSLLSITASSTQAGNLLSVFDNGGTLQGSIDKSFNWNGDAFQGIGSQFSLNTQNGGTLSLTAGGRINWTTGSNITSPPSLGFAQNGPFSAIEVNNGIPSQAGGALANFLAANATVSGVLESTLAPGTSAAFQVANSLGTPFQVDGQGDVSLNGQVNALGATSGVAYYVNSVKVIDNSQNGFFNNLTVAGTCTGCGGGGGGGGLPVSDATIITRNAGDPTKQMRFNNSGIPTATTVVLGVPPQNGTISTLENNQTVSGNNTFTNIVVGTAGFSGLAFSGNGSATASGPGQNTFQLANNNFFIDSNGNMTAACASLCTAGNNGANWITNGYVVSHTWFGMQTTPATPATVPGTGFSALTYRGGASGLQMWLYDAVHSAWTSIDLASVAGSGVTSVNGQLGPAITLQAAAGTGQINVGTASNTVTLTLPQGLAVSSNVGFGSLTVGCGGSGPATGVIQSCPGASGIAFQTSSSSYIVDAAGDITGSGQLNIGSGITPGNTVLYIQSIAVADTSRNFTVNHLTVNGGCTGCGGAGGGITSLNSQTGPAVNISSGGASLTVGAAGNTITLNTQQGITTSSTPQFAGVISSGAFNSSGSTAFQTSSGSFQVNSGGAVSASGVGTFNGGVNANTTAFNAIQTPGNVDACTGGACVGGPYAVQGVTIINASRQWIGQDILANGNVQTTGTFSVSGGFFGQARTGGINFQLAGGGTCTLFINAGIVYALSGC